MPRDVQEDRVCTLVTSGCRWVDLRTAGVEPNSRDALIARHRLPPLVGRLDDCAAGRARVERHEGGTLLAVLPAGGRTLALLVADGLVVSVGGGEARLLDRLRRVDATGAAGLAAAGIDAALAEPSPPASWLTRRRVLGDQRAVLAELAADLPLGAARARLAELAETLAHERPIAPRPPPRRRLSGGAFAAVSIVACAVIWQAHGPAIAWAAALAGLSVSFYKLWRAHVGRTHAA